MAWIHGNNPVGQQIRDGRILCEAMYAINEREAACNIAKTVWPTVGVDPAVNALAGQDVKRAIQQPIIEAMRTAIEALVPVTPAVGTPRFYAAAEYRQHVHYQKATLLNDAFGAADWCALAGRDINDVEPITEILKAVELLVHLGYTHYLDLARHKGTLKTWAGGPVATPALARAACEAMAPGAYAGMITAMGREDLNAAVGGYIGYKLYEGYAHVTTRLPATIAGVTWYAWFYEWKQGTYASAALPRIFSVNAAQWAAPAWGDIGVLRHTYTTNEWPAVYTREPFADSTFLGTGVNEVYMKTRYAVATPFLDDLTTQTGFGDAMGIFCDVTWTYN